MTTAVKSPERFVTEKDTGNWDEIAGTARCSRCGGLMVTDFWDHVEKDVAVGRCVQCGERIDPVILHNRLVHGAGAFGPRQS